MLKRNKDKNCNKILAMYMYNVEDQRVNFLEKKQKGDTKSLPQICSCVTHKLLYVSVEITD